MKPRRSKQQLTTNRPRPLHSNEPNGNTVPHSKHRSFKHRSCKCSRSTQADNDPSTNMTWKIVTLCCCVAVALYINTFSAEFAFDDNRAVLKNPDVDSSTPWTEIWKNDFWGTPINHSGSHKSYRPLCVLTFKLNHLLHGFSPGGYHLLNVFLHVTATALFTYLISAISQTAFHTLTAGLLFAIHPIHTEAVAGVVGRADVLCANFYLLTLLSYSAWRDSPLNGSRTRCLIGMMVTFILGLCAMLSKEIGVTVFAVCFIFDLFVRSGTTRINTTVTQAVQRFFQPLMFNVTSTILLLLIRLALAGSNVPDFSPSDNPAADSENVLTRTLTFLYLPSFNFALLVFPSQLSFDWSMNAIPLVESFADPRFAVTVIFYCCLAIISHYCLSFYLSSTNQELKVAESLILPEEHNITRNKYSQSNGSLHRRCRRDSDSSRDSQASSASDSTGASRCELHHPDDAVYQHYAMVTFSLALAVLPFIPATNLLFYVGFVVAERVLYIPSMGFCLLVAEYLYQLVKMFKNKTQVVTNIHIVMVVVAILLSIRTCSRCLDWRTEEQLYMSGIATNPAKAYGNLANILSSKGETEKAEQAYRAALDHRSNMADVHYNLGILLQDQGKLDEALKSYDMAISCRPKLTVAHLNKGIVLAMLSRVQEALAVYNTCASVDISGLRDPRLHESARVSALYNMGRLYAERREYDTALAAYERALTLRPQHYSPQSIYNLMGEAYYNRGDVDKAERMYSLSLESKPDHIPAHLTKARLLYKKQGKLNEADRLFRRAIELDKSDVSSYQHYGNFLSETGQSTKANTIWSEAYHLEPENFDVVFNLATSLRQLNLNPQAEHMYKQAAELSPHSATAHMNLGAMYHLNKKYSDAERSYIRALELNPSDTVTKNNLRKLRNILNKR